MAELSEQDAADPALREAFEMNRRNHPAKSAEAAMEEEKDDTKKEMTRPQVLRLPNNLRKAGLPKPKRVMKKPASATVFKRPAAKAKSTPKKKAKVGDDSAEPAETAEDEEKQEGTTPEGEANDGEETKKKREAKTKVKEKAGKEDKGKGDKTEKKDKANKNSKTEKNDKKEKDKEKKNPEKKKNPQKRDEERAKALQLDSEESGEKDAETKAEEDEEKRDVKKAYYFNKMVNQFPAEIKALWASKDVPRRDKTAMANASVTKENGRYALQLDNPVINASSVVGKECLVR